MKFWELEELQKQPLELKEQQAHKRIRTWVKLYSNKTVVACSFGKDSMIVLDIARQYNPNIPVVFCNTTNEHPETLTFKEQITKLWKLNLTELQARKTFWQCLNEYGVPPPSRYRAGTPRCCYWLKEEPMLRYVKKHNIKATLTGITAYESRVRKVSICYHGIERYAKKYHCYRIHPLATWTEQDIWHYTEKYHIPVNPVYKKQQRVGCRFCCAYRTWEKDVQNESMAAYRKIMELKGQHLL